MLPLSTWFDYNIDGKARRNTLPQQVSIENDQNSYSRPGYHIED